MLLRHARALATRTRVPAVGAWAELSKCSRAVRVGDTVHVSGTCAQGDTAADQVNAIFNNVIAPALHEAGASLDDVVITRMFASDVKRDWEELGRAHGDVFGDTKPACTLVGAELLADWCALRAVSHARAPACALLDPELLSLQLSPSGSARVLALVHDAQNRMKVEIECTAIVKS